ncbi:MAG: hypothetical protein HY902_01415 [Deltaproteobacteria bacterium]|nr:hypothetical protein [Deltaproteobacteria bacterium]
MVLTLLLVLAACGGRYEFEPYAYGGYDAAPPVFGTPGQDIGHGSDSGGDTSTSQMSDGAGKDAAGSGASDGKSDGGAGDAIAGAPDGLGEASGDGSGVCDHSKECSVDSDCPKTACNKASCKAGCCALVAVADGTTCNDSNSCTTGDTCKAGSCTGKIKDCSDPHACTDDSCDAKTGKCANKPAAGWCFIGDTCFQDTEANQENPCQICDAGKSQTAFSLGAGCCVADSDCPSGGPCDVPTCDKASSTCSMGKAPGCCTSDQECSDGNQCTLDSCDVATGKCSYQAIACSSPNQCQDGVCDPATGQCNAQTKGGWCMIDGGCYAEGDANPGNTCKICSSLTSQTSWTVMAGGICNDGNTCTFGDTCNQGGACAGTPKSGCCLADSDCLQSGDPCAPMHCDLNIGSCVPAPVPGCCTAGTCCDAGSLAIKAAGSTCGSGPLSTTYQCNGQQVQKRETWAGCNGQSPDGCSTSAGAQVVGAWQTIKTCAANTVCTLASSAAEPTCKSTQPTGSCANSCGGKSVSGSCYCDAICTSAGDCCADFLALCGCTSGECCNVAQSYPKTAGTACGKAVTEYSCSAKTLKSRTGQPSCDGKNVCVTSGAAVVWSSWTTVKTCSSTQNCAVGVGGTSGSCTAVPAGTCNGRCGGQGDGGCWCDSVCKELGDCCGDFDTKNCSKYQTCGQTATGSCNGKCGSQGAGATCWCDTACDTFGDCCSDKVICGCQ